MNTHPFSFRNGTASAGFICAWCGKNNYTFVDPSMGETQKYIENCQVCCRPNQLTVNYDKPTNEFSLRAKKTQ